MRQENANRHGDDQLNLVPEYLAETLDPKSRAAFVARLQEDAGLRATVEDLERFWANLPDRAPAGVPTPLWNSVRSRLIETRTLQLPAYDSRWRMAISFAAGVLVGLSAWLLGTGGPSLSTAAEEELLAQESIFESLDPIPPESVGGIYFALLSLEDQPEEVPR